MKSIIILCGGRSRRMGKDKGSFIFKGKPLVLHVFDAVKDIADEIIIVLRDEKQIKDYSEILNDERNIHFVKDNSKNQGPLIGIFTGLSSIKSDKAQVLPCDVPFISKEFVLKMFKTMENTDFDAAVPIWDDGHTEPLHSIYKKSGLNTIEKLINKGKRDVNSLINSLNAKFIDVEEIDSTLRSFQNMNTIEDLKSE